MTIIKKHIIFDYLCFIAMKQHLLQQYFCLLMVKKIKETTVKVEQTAKRKPKIKKEDTPSLPKQQIAPPVEKEEEKVEQQTTKHAKKSKGKQNRLIIRNLVFDIGEKHLRKLLQPFGEIVDLEVPTNPNNSKCNRGFAFVEFKSYRSCEKAIKQLNQSTFKGRTIVLDFSVNKQRFMTSQLAEEDKDSKKEKESEDIKQENKEKIEEKQQAVEEQQVDKEEAIRRQRQAQDLSSTIFIRNLPVSVSQDQLRDFFAKHGKIRWARVVIDRETNTPKGTAFVKFADSKIAQQIIEYSRSYEMFLLNKNPRFKSDPRLSLQLDGTILKVFPSEKREAIADKMKVREGKQAERAAKVKPLKKIKRLQDLIRFDKDGKRRIALAQIGLWEPSDDMAEQDRQRFAAHAKQKVQKLKNPNNSVSDRRVILKYLDKSITEQQIRDLAFEFIHAHKLKPKELTYCKLMLDNQRKRSAGFAFLQFAHPDNARTFIEELSSNYEYLSKRPYVIEFAIQDSRKLLKVQKRQGKK